jgi:hypothetical protein
MAKATRPYSAKLKFQVVLEALRGDKSPAQIAKAYRVHPNSVGIWRRWFLERVRIPLMGNARIGDREHVGLGLGAERRGLVVSALERGLLSTGRSLEDDPMGVVK